MIRTHFLDKDMFGHVFRHFPKKWQITQLPYFRPNDIVEESVVASMYMASMTHLPFIAYLTNTETDASIAMGRTEAEDSTVEVEDSMQEVEDSMQEVVDSTQEEEDLTQGVEDPMQEVENSKQEMEDSMQEGVEASSALCRHSKQ